MKHALVTGAGGFTGSALCRGLIKEGVAVTGLVRPGSNQAALSQLDLRVVEGDIGRDGGIPPEAYEGVDTVFHIAALFRQEGATRDVFHNVNALGTQRVLQGALQAGVQRVVHCSTAGVHGWIDAGQHATETSPFRPGDWYQETKLEGEQLARQFGQEHNLPMTIIRPSAIFGPGDLRFLKLFRSISNRHFCMIGDGAPHYHFVYIDDLVRGFILAARKPEAVGETFIIAGQRPVPIRDIIHWIAKEVGQPPPRLQIPVWPVMTAARLCKTLCAPLGIQPPLYPRRLDFFLKNRSFSSQKAETMLGYTPAISPEEGIARTAEWYREQKLL